MNRFFDRATDGYIVTVSKSRISVVLPVYGGDDPSHFDDAVSSVLSQTRRPDEVVLVRDGPVPDTLADVLSRLVAAHDPVVVVPFEENRGRAVARQVGIERANGDYVAMMDADDLSLPERLERQARFLDEHSEIDLVGTQIIEIDAESEEHLAVRSLPTDHDDIASLARSRAPVSQSSVMARRDAILAAGNYRDVDRMEDYDLWVRMLVDGARFANIPETLVKARTGDEMYERRGGFEYAREELRMQVEFFRMGFTSLPRAVTNILTRVSIRFVPNRIRAFVYERFFRDDP